MELLYWHWIVFGVGLILLELVIPSFTALWFGLGAVLVGIGLLIEPDLSGTVQIAAWASVSVVLTSVWFKFLKPSSHKSQQAQQHDVAGELGLVIAKASENKPGKVRFSTPILGLDEWDFRSDDLLEAGDQVEIKDIDNGVLIAVKK